MLLDDESIQFIEQADLAKLCILVTLDNQLNKENHEKGSSNWGGVC